MAFIDWNNNGELDDDDIAFAVALMASEDDEKMKPQKTKNATPGCGCLTGTFLVLITMVNIVSLFILVIAL